MSFPRDLRRAHEVLSDCDAAGVPRRRDGLGSARVTAWVNGVVRHRRTLHALVGAVARRAFKHRAAQVTASLELGAFLVLFSEQDAGELEAHFGPLSGGRKGREHVQRVLGALAAEVAGREGPQEGGADLLPLDRQRSLRFRRPLLELGGRTEATRLGLLHSYPDALVESWLERFGPEQTAELCRAGNDPPPLFARANPLRTTREQLLDALREEQVEAEPRAELPCALRLRVGAQAFQHTAPWRAGWLTIQDLTAQRAAPTLAPRPGERVLDACAAPGTKTTALAEESGDQARILALDANARRLGRVRQNCQRLGLGSVEVQVQDARQAGPLAELGPFDAALVDAPCSNTGVLRRRAEARWRYQRRGQRRLVQTQEEILQASLSALREGGRLLWSVCAIEPEEGEALVRRVCQERPGLELLDEHLALPHPDGGDGGYQALLRRG